MHSASLYQAHQLLGTQASMQQARTIGLLHNHWFLSSSPMARTSNYKKSYMLLLFLLTRPFHWSEYHFETFLHLSYALDLSPLIGL